MVITTWFWTVTPNIKPCLTTGRYVKRGTKQYYLFPKNHLRLSIRLCSGMTLLSFSIGFSMLNIISSRILDIIVYYRACLWCVRYGVASSGINKNCDSFRWDRKLPILTIALHLLGNCLISAPVIKSHPGAFLEFNYFVITLQNIREIFTAFMGPSRWCGVSSLMMISDSSGVISDVKDCQTFIRCSAKTFTFSRSSFAQLPSIFLGGGMGFIELSSNSSYQVFNSLCSK